MEKLYRIEELTTEGWTLLDDKAVKLTKTDMDDKLLAQVETAIKAR